jgi:hypothetical protein
MIADQLSSEQPLDKLKLYDTSAECRSFILAVHTSSIYLPNFGQT